MAAHDLPGRGTTANPPNRFEQLHVELDPDPDGFAGEAGAPGQPTLLYRDASKTILAENDSPDVGFRFSLNPYRGCEHGCVYCLGPDTPVLHADMTWRPIGEVQVGDVLVGFDEQPAPGTTRTLRPALVEAVWWSRRPSVRLVTDETSVTTTPGHRWLPWGDSRWSRTARLAPGRRLRRIPMVAADPDDDDYRLGYFAGLALGDGTFRWQPGRRSDRRGRPAADWRVALVDEAPLLRLVDFLASAGVEAHVRALAAEAAARKALLTVAIRSLARLAVIHGLLTAERDTRSYRRGFVAGFFDADGSNAGSRRVFRVDRSALERVRSHAAALGFAFDLESPRDGTAGTLRLRGRVTERIRFFSVCRPAIARTMQAVVGHEMHADPAPVRAVEPGSVADVVDIQTSTGTFFAAGLATHNCYARPSHEYLGWSAGLDFERRLLVKEDAPVLLRRALASPRWEPQVVALSGNTDAWQPVERKLEITRRCLEVFSEFRNPVGAITKSALVARDADLFGALARHGAAHVLVSVTTLDAGLARRMEPRAARPERRLDAIRALAAAGVPVGVMIGPVIPGLTDAEIPRILEAAARAGATSASWVLLRLPPPVDALFADWLERHYPERKARVLNHVRAVRAGRLSDSTFGRRQRGQGEYAKQIAALFAAASRKYGLDRPLPGLSAAAFRRPPQPGDQLTLL